jgi:hypothetical protein
MVPNGSAGSQPSLTIHPQHKRHGGPGDGRDDVGVVGQRNRRASLKQRVADQPAAEA